MLKYIIIILKIFNWNTIYKYFIKLQKLSKFLLSDTCLI